MNLRYDIFARKTHPEPLVYIGSVEAIDANDAIKASLEKYGPEREWLEMVAVPHQAVIVVFPEPEEGSQR
jgi:1,2-phenylacetyl-CoA epoxidase PaaB subunit